MTQAGWPERLVASVAAQVKFHRVRQKVSAQQLSTATAELGLPIPRSVLANLESGRRETVTVPEVLVLAEALRVPPLLLMIPVGQVERMEVLPDVEVTPWEAAQWAIGERTLPGRHDLGRGHGAVGQFRSHDFAVRAWRQSQQDLRRPWKSVNKDGDVTIIDPKLDFQEAQQRVHYAEQQLATLRAQMREHGLNPPSVPAELAHIDSISTGSPPPEFTVEATEDRS